MIRHPYMVRITPQCLYDFDRQRRVARPRINHQAHDHDPLAPVARGRAQHKQVPVVPQAVRLALLHRITARSSGIAPTYSMATGLSLTARRSP
jgi:hypothetical protein